MSRRAVRPARLTAALAEIAESFHDRHLKTTATTIATKPVHIVSARLAAVRRAPRGDGEAGRIRTARQIQASGLVVDGSGRRNGYLRAQGGCRGTGRGRPAVIEALESTNSCFRRMQAKMNEDGFVLLSHRQGDNAE